VAYPETVLTFFTKYNGNFRLLKVDDDQKVEEERKENARLNRSPGCKKWSKAHLNSARPLDLQSGLFKKTGSFLATLC
jgi:hypothetical protein